MALEDESAREQAALVPVSSFRLIPVGLKEAALDSPTFRATVVHFSDQVDGIEKWLDGVVKHATRLSQEASVLDSLVNAFFTHASAPNHLSEAMLDHDYTMRAMYTYNQGAKEFMGHTTAALKAMQGSLVDPLRNFVQSEIRPYRDARRTLDQAQRNYDSILLRYQGQGKNKEPSSLREDAFQLHEARKVYLKASMDVCVLGPQLRLALDSLLIQVFSDQWFKVSDFRVGSADSAQKLSKEMNRIRSWSKDLAQNERVLRRELLLARKDIEQGTELAARPSRELDDYSVSTVPYLGSRPAAAEDLMTNSRMPSKQGWLLQRTITGKPARTSWVRRWFFVRNGIFGYLLQDANSGGVEESEKIGVLLCGIRPAFQEERRFCFEVKTKDTSMMLQAETQAELTDWIAIFEIAKRQAIEQPGTTELLATSGTDAAFAISPATAPELAVKHADTDKDENVGLLTAEPDTIGPLNSRNSIDVSTLRRGTADRDGEGRTRDHAARIIEKLDLHRKSSAISQVSKGNIQPPGGGIASLISASHGSLGIQPTRPGVRQVSEGRKDSTSLAPDTLAMPPQPTALSKTAIMVGMERRHTLSSADSSSGGLPGGLLANHWGAANYGYINRAERGEQHPRGSSPADPISQIGRSSTEPSESVSELSKMPSAVQSGSPTRMPPSALSLHRKTLSSADELPSRNDLGMDLPKFYPPALRAHDAQFRLLFPDVPRDERVVLVSRVSWSLSDTQDLPGRVYFTERGCYFYSNHLGLVLVVNIDIDAILDVSIVPYQDYDLLNLTMRGKREREEPYVIAVKSFLEPIRLLKRRINFLVDNVNAEEPSDLEDVLRHLISLERPQVEHSPATDDWEDLANDYNQDSPVRRREVQVRVDRMPYGGDSAVADINEPTRFRLPPQPVNHIPSGCTNLAAERIYDVSAKALFHIMFGDASAIFQMLYHERRASNVRQFPWQMDNAFHRSFTYDVTFQDSLNRQQTSSVIDTQVIEVTNDHLCYVVSDERSPWHLPYPDQFRLSSKIVITHYSKSRSRLAIWTAVRWANRAPPLTRNMIERHALDDLHIDAMATQDLVADQVARLGSSFTTKRAVQAFGHIGRQTDVAAITVSAETIPASLKSVGSPQRLLVRKKTLVGLLWESFRSLALSAASTVLMSAIGLGRAVAKAFSAHFVLLALLLALASVQLIATRNVTAQWWHDRTAVRYMRQLGVGPDAVMARAVFLKDIPQMAASAINDTEWSLAEDGTGGLGGAKCARAFHAILQESDPALPASANISTSSGLPHAPMAKAITDRLSRARLRLGTRRHDLLVSLRLVNRIERETIRAEYEEWLVEEGVKCTQVGRIIARVRSGRGAAPRTDGEGREAVLEKDLVERLKGEKLERVRQWYDDYCESCRKERDVILGMNM
ncbi:hypothetical protein FH972_022624 [Carpinus fangiana]|uniref:Uncharacterized protein n=1 Tax=Carpinus fangiana TaxID=176857 RepID=A0A5N6KT41_9ROSI|nr:hypothetical protein FH972_022624 [Carpinus fangiana]